MLLCSGWLYFYRYTLNRMKAVSSLLWQPGLELLRTHVMNHFLHRNDMYQVWGLFALFYKTLKNKVDKSRTDCDGKKSLLYSCSTCLKSKKMCFPTNRGEFSETEFSGESVCGKPHSFVMSVTPTSQELRCGKGIHGPKRERNAFTLFSSQWESVDAYSTPYQMLYFLQIWLTALTSLASHGWGC